MISLTVPELSRWQTIENKQTNMQTDTTENTTTLAVWLVITEGTPDNKWLTGSAEDNYSNDYNYYHNYYNYYYYYNYYNYHNYYYYYYYYNYYNYHNYYYYYWGCESRNFQ